MQCTVCSFLVTLLENYAIFKKVDIAKFIAEKVVCEFFDNKTKTTCIQTLELLGPAIIEGFLNKENSDVICNKTGLCKGFETCKLHSKSE